MSSNDVWGHGGSSQSQHPVRKNSDPLGLALAIIGVIVAAAGGLWKVIQSFQPPVEVTEGGNDFSGADLPILILVIGFAIVALGVWRISRARRSR